jgi:hypothetical protein
MAKIPMWMEFIAGLLLAYDLLPKSGALLKFHNWIRDGLVKTNTKDLLNRRTLVFNLIISFFIFLMLVAWAWYKNSNQEAYNVGAESGLFLLGIVIAWAIITPIAALLKKFGQESLIFPTGLIISVISLVIGVNLNPSANIMAVLIAFVYISFLYPFAMIIASYIQKALLAQKDKPFYIFAMLGIALFAVSKIFELTV